MDVGWQKFAEHWKVKKKLWKSRQHQITAFEYILCRDAMQKMPTLKSIGRDARGKNKSAPSKKPTRPVPPPASFKSAEYVQESDDEPENSEKGNESESNNESLPSNAPDVMITPNGKLQRPAGSSSSSENESDSDENGSEADDEEEEEEEPIIAAIENVAVSIK